VLSKFIRKLFGPIPKNKLPRFMYKFAAFLWFVGAINIVISIFSKAYSGFLFGLIINLVFLLILFPLLVRVVLKINGKIMNWEFDKDA
jgi:hypothetical protein